MTSGGCLPRSRHLVSVLEAVWGEDFLHCEPVLTTSAIVRANCSLLRDSIGNGMNLDWNFPTHNVGKEHLKGRCEHSAVLAAHLFIEAK